MISMGDIARAEKKGMDYVSVNKNFTWILPGEYMRARKIFYERPNINAIPVVGVDNILLGHYERWDDLNVEYMFGIVQGIPACCGSVFLVRPCNIFDGKIRMYGHFCEYLFSMGIVVQELRHEEVADYVDAAEWILFVDENEWRAADTLQGFQR